MTPTQLTLSAFIFILGWLWRRFVWMPRERGSWEREAVANGKKKGKLK